MSRMHSDNNSETVSTSLTAATATRGQRAGGIAMMLTSSASSQAGAALGASAFAMIGPIGVVAVRQLVTAAVLGVAVRPRLGSLTARQWRLVLGLVLVFSVMNLGLYTAIDRIGLALAVTLEFLGPLSIAIAASRRILDLGCALLAGVGVVILTNPGPSTDVIGVAAALVAAGAWAAYILLNRALGQELPGIQGTAAASMITAALWVPIATVWFITHPPTAAALVLAAACGLLSSAVPYASDLLTLRRITTQMFGTLTSVSPVWAALAGWLILGQTLQANEWTGITLITASNVLVSIHGTLAQRTSDGAKRNQGQLQRPTKVSRAARRSVSDWRSPSRRPPRSHPRVSRSER